MKFKFGKLSKDKLIGMGFVLILPLLALILAYKLVLFWGDFNTGQQQVIDYVTGTAEELSEDYTVLEISHLNDVLAINKKLNYLFWLLLAGAVLILISSLRQRSVLKKLVLSGGAATAGLGLVMSIVAAAGFNKLFLIFHYWLFPQGNWSFPVNYRLIEIFPQEFFVAISRNILVLTIFIGIVFIVASFLIQNKHRAID